MKYYSSTMDKETRAIAVSKSSVLLLSMVVLVVLFFKDGYESVASVILISAGLFAISLVYVGLYLSAPSEYVLTHNALIIKKPLSKVKIALREIETVNLVNTSEYLRTTRTNLRNSGLFGYTGFQMIENIKTKLYIKRKKDNILITLFGKNNIIISPDDIIMIIDLTEALDSIN